MSNHNTKVSGIYKITNTVNGKIYVGSAVNIKHRWETHISDLRKNKHHSPYLQRAWNKYGSDVFEFSVIETCFVFALILREQYYIDKLKPSYNVNPTANSRLGAKQTQASRNKMSVAKAGLMVGYKHSAEARRNMSNAAKNMTPEHKKKISDTHKGMGHTKEIRNKIANAVKSLWDNPDYRKHMSDVHKGKKPSRETIEKRIISIKAAWAHRKAKK